MVPHAASGSSFGNSRRRRHGAWDGSSAMVELPGFPDAGDGFSPHPHAAGNDAVGDRCVAPPRACVLGTIMSPQNFNFMFYGFTVAWLIIIGYVISIALREKKLRQELDRVKRMVEENEQANTRRQ